jgi:hypothetical protein
MSMQFPAIVSLDDQIRYYSIKISRMKSRIYAMVMHLLSVLVPASIYIPAVVCRGAQVCVICICMGTRFVFVFCCICND